MSPDEMEAILKALSQQNINQWERTRLQSYYSVVAMAGTKQIKKPSDLFALPWDKDKKEKIHKPLSREDLAKMHSKFLNQK